MHDQSRDLDRLLDIQEQSAFVIEHRPAEKDDFMNNKVLRLAILKSLENIGEAANQISKQTKNLNLTN